MLVSAAPVAIPVTTANPPTESVAAEAAQKPPVPAPKPATESATNKPAQDNNADTKNNLQNQQRIDGNPRGREDADAQSQEQGQSEQEQRRKQAELAEIQKLQTRDRQVRAHETAHASAGGQLAGAPQLDFKTGPDGKRYAVSGEVQIDTAKVAGDPEATIRKMQQVQRAALAPADPSAQDLAVAAKAAQIANQARVEARALQNSEPQSSDTKANSANKDDGQIRNARAPVFASPVVARRQALQLEQRLKASGAFEDINQQPLFEANA